MRSDFVFLQSTFSMADNYDQATTLGGLSYQKSIYRYGPFQNTSLEFATLGGTNNSIIWFWPMDYISEIIN